MLGEDGPWGFCERPAVKAAVAGLAVLYAAALAAGLLDGVPPERPGLVQAAAGERGAPGPPPVSALCFRGPRGEPVDFSAGQHCHPAAAGARAP